MITFVDALVLLPDKLIRRWPAIILAVSRTASDPGRIILLIVPMPTIKGISIPGLPAGIKCLNICCVLLIHSNNIIDNQRQYF